MKPGAGKAKGAAFERYVCKRLSLWISNGKRDDLFWRSAMSGGRVTIALKSGRISGTQAGDITALAGSGKEFVRARNLTENFMIECKHVKSLDFHRLVSSGEGFIRKTWEKAKESCRPATGKRLGQVPLLIIKQNVVPELVVFDRARMVSHFPEIVESKSYVTLNFQEGDNIKKIGIINFDEWLEMWPNRKTIKH